MLEPSLRVQWITPAEVARMLGVTPRTVSRWSDRGMVPCVWTPGGKRRFRTDDILRLIAEGALDLVPEKPGARGPHGHWTKDEQDEAAS